jgi:hypothetical protein
VLKGRIAEQARRGVALRFAVSLAAAIFAALAAHIVIDIAGDYVLAHDAYDAPAHGSRYVASLSLAALALGAMWALFRAALAETRGTLGALRAALKLAVPRSALAFGFTVTTAALPVLLGMAWLDDLCAGVTADDLTDLFGGSIPLGAGIAIAFALAVAAGVHRIVALLHRFHRSITRVVGAFVRIVRAAANEPLLATLDAKERPRVPTALRRASGANRAPPIPNVRVLPA